MLGILTDADPVLPVWVIVRVLEALLYAVPTTSCIDQVSVADAADAFRYVPDRFMTGDDWLVAELVLKQAITHETGAAPAMVHVGFIAVLAAFAK